MKKRGNCQFAVSPFLSPYAMFVFPMRCCSLLCFFAYRLMS